MTRAAVVGAATPGVEREEEKGETGRQMYSRTGGKGRLSRKDHFAERRVDTHWMLREPGSQKLKLTS